MSSTASFLSKLFGRSVSRPTPNSDGGPSSSSLNGGSPSHDEYSDANGSSPAASKPLRYLSPTAMESTYSRVSNRVAESTSDSARKRPLENPQATSGFTNGSFYLSDTAKRFRGSAANTSLVSEPVTRLDLPRLDTTWSAGMGVFSPSNLSCSPNSSVRSLRSRITRPSSRTSVLSSKTAALLGQIEKVSTPAQDARRMPMLRVGLSKERWNSLGPSTSSNPPLNRISTAPSRYQVMSSFLTPMQKKPYWRDVARERPEVVSEESTVPSEPCSSVSTATRTTNGETNGVKEQTMRASTHQPVLKGTDGSKVNRDRNRFSANEISMDDSATLAELNNVKGPDASQFSLPTTGFLSKNVAPSFSFNKPVKVTVETMEESESSDESESENESSGSESGSVRDEDSDSGREDDNKDKKKTTEKTSDTSSSAENTSKETSNEESKKVSPPRDTANASSSTAVAKPVAVIESSTAVISASISSSSSTNWDCTGCYVSNKAVDVKCVCCGESKPGTASTSSSSNVFGANAFNPSGASTSSAVSSANWDCPSCCVSNKAVDFKCACCGESKPGATAPPSSSSNVFGNKAFKPTASSSTVTFGFGSASSAPSVPSVPSSIPSFGIKPSTEISSSTPSTGQFTFGLKPSTESAIPASTSLPTITITQPTTVASKPIFGVTSTPTTIGTNGGFSFGMKAANGESVKNGSSNAVPSIPSIPLFPSTSSASSTTAPLFGLPPASSISSTTSTATPPVSSTPLFTSSSFTPSSSIFGASSGGSTLSSLPPFGSSSTTTPASSAPLFGSSTLSTTTPSIPLFGGVSSTGSSVAAPPSVLGTVTPSLPFTFGPSGATGSLPKVPSFGSSTETKNLFGSSKPMDDEGPGAKKAMFGSSSTFTFGGQNNSTGASTNVFGSSGGSSGLFGGLTQSASTPSFSLPTAPPTSFNFGSQPSSSVAPPSTFNFGASQPSSVIPSSTAATPFVFGSQPTQPAAPSFGIGMFGAPSAAPSLNVPAAPDASNPFAFHSSSSSSSGSRKMIQAKRRLPGKR